MIGLLYELVVTRNIILILGEPELYEGDDTHFGLSLDPNAGSVQLLQQYCDTDLTLAGSNYLTIIQCKATAASTPAKITVDELSQILVDAAKQVEKIRKGGDTRSIGQFILVSNRTLVDKLCDLESQCKSLNTEEASPCPDALNTKGQKGLSLGDWCRQLKDTSKKVSPLLTTELVANIIELLPRFRFSRLNYDLAERNFTKSLERLGLFQNEIQDARTALNAELINAMATSSPVEKALKNRFFSSAIKSLCPDELKPIQSEERNRSIGLTGLKITDLDDPKWSLPRHELVQDVMSALDNVIARPCSALCLVGEGGSGKTHLLYSLPGLITNHFPSKSDFFGYVDGSIITHDPVSQGLAAVFQGYAYNSKFVERLVRAFSACGKELRLWIVIPNSDELGPSQLKNLLVLISSMSNNQAKFLLTARSSAWENCGREFTNIARVEVRGLDREELDRFFASLNNQKQPLLGPSSWQGSGLVGSVSVTRSDIIEDAWFDTPLCFGAFRDWCRADEGGAHSSRVSEFVAGDPDAVRSFSEHAGSFFCRRIHKHAGLMSISLNAIKSTFNTLWKRRGELHKIPRGQWNTELCAGLPLDKSEFMLNQFVQTGVLEYRSTDEGSIGWKLRLELPVEGIV